MKIKSGCLGSVSIALLTVELLIYALFYSKYCHLFNCVMLLFNTKAQVGFIFSYNLFNREHKCV